MHRPSSRGAAPTLPTCLPPTLPPPARRRRRCSRRTSSSAPWAQSCFTGARRVPSVRARVTGCARCTQLLPADFACEAVRTAVSTEGRTMPNPCHTPQAGRRQLRARRRVGGATGQGLGQGRGRGGGGEAPAAEGHAGGHRGAGWRARRLARRASSHYVCCTVACAGAVKVALHTRPLTLSPSHPQPKSEQRRHKRSFHLASSGNAAKVRVGASTPMLPTRPPPPLALLCLFTTACLPAA